MPTGHQDKAFAEEMRDSVDEVKMSTSTLDNAISWIAANLDPEDVFDEKKLKGFATNYDPDDIFEESTLQSWAEENGYTKE